jgi:hypothetical protein
VEVDTLNNSERQHRQFSDIRQWNYNANPTVSPKAICLYMKESNGTYVLYAEDYGISEI